MHIVVHITSLLILLTSTLLVNMHVQQQGPQGLHHTDVSASQPDLIKPRIDTLEYRFLTLPNSLRCLLISDPETEKAAAALDVRLTCALMWCWCERPPSVVTAPAFSSAMMLAMPTPKHRMVHI